MIFSLYHGITFTNLYIALIVVSILFFLIWKRLELGLALFTVGDIFLRAVYFDPVLGIFSGRKGFLYPLAFYVIVLFGIHILFRKKNLRIRMIRPRIIYFFALFIFIVVLTYFLNPRDEYALGWRGHFSRLIPVILPFAGVILLSSEKERLIRYVNYVFGFSAIITISYGIAYLRGIHEGIPILQMRNVPVFDLYLGSGSTFAAICAIFCVIRLSKAQNLKNRITYSLLLILSLIIISLGMSRIIILASALALTYMLGRIFSLPKRTINSLAFVIFMLGIISFLLVFENVPILNEIFSVERERLETTFKNPAEAGGARLEMYSKGWDGFLVSPVIGVGAGNSGLLVYAPIDPNKPHLGFGAFRQHMHSFYFEVLAEQGTLGTLILLCFFFHLGKIVNLNKRINKNSGYLYELKVLANSTIILSLVMGITGSATLFFWASALAWTAYNWFCTSKRQVNVNGQKPVYLPISADSI